jgi:hypothetical protein
MLEYHHCEPSAMGGETSVDQVTLRCRMHNAYAAQMDFGRSFMEARRRGRLDAPAVREAGVVYRQRGVAAEAAPVRRAG